MRRSGPLVEDSQAERTRPSPSSARSARYRRPGSSRLKPSGRRRSSRSYPCAGCSRSNSSRHGRRKFFGRTPGAASGVDMASTLLKALGSGFGRLVTPAVLVALAVARAGHAGELVGERALADLLAAAAQPIPGRFGQLEVAVLDEPLE